MIRAALFDLDGVIRHFDTSGLTEIEERVGHIVSREKCILRGLFSYVNS